jgi:hypothetical protein
VGPPLQFVEVGSFPGLGCIIPQPYATGGNQSYLGVMGHNRWPVLPGVNYPDTASIRARSGLNIHCKHLKIASMFKVMTLSPYKDYSSLLRWQANICVHFVTTELNRRRYVVVFRVFDLFCC